MSFFPFKPLDRQRSEWHHSRRRGGASEGRSTHSRIKYQEGGLTPPSTVKPSTQGMKVSYPKRKDLFDAWYKAMVAGATVDKPNYGKSQQGGARPQRPKHPRRMRRGNRWLRKKRRMMNG